MTRRLVAAAVCALGLTIPLIAASASSSSAATKVPPVCVKKTVGHVSVVVGYCPR